MDKKLRALFLSPEAAPFAKTGGLGDVAGSLSNALAELGVEVWLMLPGYRMVRDGGWKTETVLTDMKVELGTALLKGRVSRYVNGGGASVFFIEREDLFDRPNLYGTGDGEYYDNLERFTYFCRAALLFAKRMDFKPDIVHCNDWQTGLTPCYLKNLHGRDPFFSRTSSVFTIHNIGYQGLFPAERLPITGLSYALFNPSGLEYYGTIGLLKAGIVYSDAVVTVSPEHSREILSPEFGQGLEGLLREQGDKLNGILNGVDYKTWNPATDVYLKKNYSPMDMSGKSECKKALLAELGMDDQLADRMVLGMVTRITRQKGVELFLEAAGDLIEMGVGLVLLGEGEQEYKNRLTLLAKKYPGRISVNFGFSESLAHSIIAGSDVLLMPSLYEPCGLAQMYGLKYGTVPLVRATGGLKDTIVHFDPRTGSGNGFMIYGYDPDELKEEVGRALKSFQQPEVWTILQRNGMAADFSWDRSAKTYLDLYAKLTGRFDAFPRDQRAG